MLLTADLSGGLGNFFTHQRIEVTAMVLAAVRTLGIIVKFRSSRYRLDRKSS